jgi:membrane protein
MPVMGYRVGPLVKRTGREVLEDNVLSLAAANAYNFFFSLFPIFLFLAPLIGLIGDKHEVFNELMRQAARTVPPEAFALVRDVVESVVFAPGAPGLVSVGALLALWSGSNIFSSLTDALNAAYDVEKDERPFWKRRLIAIACLIGVGSLFVLATIVMLAGGDIVNKLADWLHIGIVGQIVWTVVQYAIALGILVATAWSVYYFLPCVRQSKMHALVGAVVATVLWLVVTMGFRFYVQNFASYNKTYGTIGGVIVLLTWMYLSMVVLITGGELASELHKGTGAVRTRAGHLYDGRISTGRPTEAASVDQVEPVAPQRFGGGPLAPAR